MAISKVIYGGKTLIDLTSDTVTAEKVLSGYTAHGADGEAITGTCTYDVCCLISIDSFLGVAWCYLRYCCIRFYPGV